MDGAEQHKQGTERNAVEGVWRVVKWAIVIEKDLIIVVEVNLGAVDNDSNSKANKNKLKQS